MWEVTIEAGSIYDFEDEADRIVALYEEGGEANRADEINRAVDVVRDILDSGQLGTGKHSITAHGSDTIEEDDPNRGLFLTISINQHIEPPASPERPA